MSKLVITADVHGSIDTWNKITTLLNDEDTLAIAGDLFDTVYGNYGTTDFQPEVIKKEFIKLPCTKYYVYGNCDSEKFFVEQKRQLSFKFDNLTFFLNHGHYHLPDLIDYDVIIEGHSHVAKLNSVMGKVFLNPGSPVLPRENGPTYAILEDNTIRIINIDNNQTRFHLQL